MIVDMVWRSLRMQSERVPSTSHAVRWSKSTNGRIQLHPQETNRIGDVFITMDNKRSTGHEGRVTCDGASMHIQSSVPNHMQHTVGAKDLLEGKHRLIFDLKEQRVFIQ